jgi:hypothetical protein
VSHVCTSVSRIERLLRPQTGLQKPNTNVYGNLWELSGDSLKTRTSSWYTSRIHRSLFGSLTVYQFCQTTYRLKGSGRKDEGYSSLENKFLFRFRPSRWVSRYMIELRVRWFQSDGSLVHIGLTPLCRKMCMDVEVVRSLGLKTCKSCITNSQDNCTCDAEEYPQPDPKAVRRFLDCGSLLGSDSLYYSKWDGTITILEVSVPNEVDSEYCNSCFASHNLAWQTDKWLRACSFPSTAPIVVGWESAMRSVNFY